MIVILAVIWLLIFSSRATAETVEVQATDIYVVATSNPTTPKSLNLKVPSKLWASCVLTAKYMLGVNESWGHAKNMKPNTKSVEVGTVVLFSGHVAVVKAIEGDTLHIIEANWIPSKLSERSMLISDKSIRGFFDPQ